MSFHEQVALDIGNVFLNTEEFVEPHNLDGTELMAVVSISRTRPKSGTASRNYDGLHGDFATVNIRKEDLPHIPKEGDNIRLDGRRYTVEECKDIMGMLRLVLSAYRMGGVR